MQCFGACTGTGSRRRKVEEEWDDGPVSASGIPNGQPPSSLQRDRSRRGGPSGGAHLFKDKHVLARPVAKDKLKTLINNAKKATAGHPGVGGGGGDDKNEDPEYTLLARMYSEVDPSHILVQVSRSRESLYHLLPFIINAILYGFRDYGAPGSSVGGSGGSIRAKKSSALKIRSSLIGSADSGNGALSTDDPAMALSINGTSALVRAQCERALESFLHQQATRSVYFALDCTWYLTTALFTGPPAAYHRTMQILLSMESVVTSYQTIPGDLFRRADISGGGVHAALPPSGTRAASLQGKQGKGRVSRDGLGVSVNGKPEGGRSGGSLDDDDDGGVSSDAQVQLHQKADSMPVGNAVVTTVQDQPNGGKKVSVDTTGDGVTDLKIAFTDVRRADEIKLRQWLEARSERENMFHAELDFIKCLTDISNGLFDIDRDCRRDVLRRELEKLNSHIPQNVFIPTERRQHRVLRIVPEAAHVFNTKERVPYLLVLEVEDLGPLPSSSAHTGHFVPDEGGLGHGGVGDGSALSGHGLSDSHSAGIQGAHGSVVLGHGASNIPGGDGVSSVGVGEATVPNMPGEKFAFQPEMTTSGSGRLVLHGSSPLTEEEAGSLSRLGKRESSFRVDTEYNDDRRPPDEDLIRAMGEPWVVKSERLRKESPFGSNPNWRLISCIVKARDQLQQEMLAQRLIAEFAHVFKNSNLPLWLLPYNIIATSREAGLIETVVDAKSIDSIKKDSPGVVTLQDYFIGRFGGRGSSGYKRAVKNFVQSMAGYSVVSYLLNIKDRHNGNLMIDSQGHVIHIDFGFLLSNSPGGNMEFERSPFKLTNEMAQVMGGTKSGAWKLFRKLSIQGYVEACRHANKVMLMVDTAYPGNESMPCFLQGRDYVLSGLRERFGVDLTRRERAARMARLIDTAHGNWTTRAYDQFQRLSLGIAK